MSLIKKIDEYRLTTVYTAGALAASAAYEIYDNQYEVPDQRLSRDMILGFLFAAILSAMISCAKKRRTKVFASIASFTLWAGRLICGVMMSSFSDIYRGEDNSLIYWCITGFGILSAMISVFGQWLRNKRENRENAKELEPVKLRFVA
jgi:uncharacterized BrkB/YihY/UPF0761 family membrane protein